MISKVGGDASHGSHGAVAPVTHACLRSFYSVSLEKKLFSSSKDRRQTDRALSYFQP